MSERKYKVGDCFISNNLFSPRRVLVWVTEADPKSSMYVLESNQADVDLTLYITERALDEEYDRRSDHDRPN